MSDRYVTWLDPWSRKWRLNLDDSYTRAEVHLDGVWEDRSQIPDPVGDSTSLEELVRHLLKGAGRSAGRVLQIGSNLESAE